jgi:hypothetical protein
MNKQCILMTLALAVALSGCGKHQPRQFVVLPDVSGSIDRESLQQAFEAIDELASHLRRGDRLTIIPILDDAEAEASGKILRFEVPANRQAYDADLGAFQRSLHLLLIKLKGRAVAHPGEKTDILGSIALAQQEFVPERRRCSACWLIILSDFIEDDRKIDFRFDRRLSHAAPAERFATALAGASKSFPVRPCVYLGMLRSYEFVALMPSRRNAVESFWTTYFAAQQITVSFHYDGPGQLKSLTCAQGPG